jgi:hypothetical protein
MAMSVDTRPHFATIADFISSMEKEIVALFLEVLLVCDEQGLVVKEMFAIDGCKMPSNASKEWSGTRKDFRRKAAGLRSVRFKGLQSACVPCQQRSKCLRYPDRTETR